MTNLINRARRSGAVTTAVPGLAHSSPIVSGEVLVVGSGPDFELAAKNSMGSR